MSKIKDTPVCVVGGGMVGLTFALLCAQQDVAVTVIESRDPPINVALTRTARVSALNPLSISYLQKIRVWEKIPQAEWGVFRSLLVWDALTGADVVFDSAEMAADSLGANVSNMALVQALWRQALVNPLVQVVSGTSVERLLAEDKGVTLQLSDGQLLAPQLVVGADGAHSWLRKQMGVVVQEQAYQHTACVTVVRTQQPHQERGWQVFLPSGPLALLPLDDAYECAVVWSMLPQQAETLATEEALEIAAKMSDAFGNRLGGIEVLLPLQAVPLMRRHAAQYTRANMALVGDAAHTIHPLAGQGANLGLRDAAALADLLAAAHAKGRNLGAEFLLQRYERQRRADNQLMMNAMQFFQDGFANSGAVWTQLRKMGMKGLNRVSPLKQACMRYAMGI